MNVERLYLRLFRPWLWRGVRRWNRRHPGCKRVIVKNISGRTLNPGECVDVTKVRIIR